MNTKKAVPGLNYTQRIASSGKRHLIASLPASWLARLVQFKNGGLQNLAAAKHVKDGARGLAAKNSEVRNIQKQNEAMTGFLGKLAEGPWMNSSLCEGLLDLHTQQPSLVMSLASGLLREPYSERYGLLALIKIQFKRKIYSYVAQLADRYPPDLLIDDAFEEAATSYGILRSPSCAPLVRKFLETLPPADAGLGSHEGRAIIAIQAAILSQDSALLAEILERCPKADAYAVAPRSYALARLQAEDWLKRYRQPVASFARTGSLKLGILGYGSPLKPSTNIGDYVQTIALLGLMARSLPDDVLMHGGGADTFRIISNRVKKRARASASAYDRVDAIWIDRDDTSTTPEGEKIWLPVNGWFMHPKAEDLYDFPFAENIRPIFVGMHINRPQMLTPTTVAYLKKYAPIGARDYHTAELLMANGVDAFFSGCPTLTLDNIFGRQSEAGRSGQYFAAHKASNNVGASRKQMIHSDPAMPTWSKDRGLATAWDYLTAYANASDVETTLLHCYLPCRAMNTPVTFTNANAKTDTRFEGLIGITDQNRTAVAAKITANIDAVMDLILSGADEADVYKAWNVRNAVGVAEIRARLEAKKPKVNIAANDAGHATQDFPKKSFKAGIEGPPPQAGQKCVDVVFCYDKNFDRATFVTLRSMLANTTSPLRVTLLTRGLEKDRIEAISRAFPQCEIVWLDVTKVKFKGLKLLRHTTESTMDRLFLPQFLDYTDRVLYLDVDIVVLGDIKDLYDLDLGDNALAARMTVFPGWASGYSLGQLIEKQLTPKQTELFRRQFVYGEPLGYGCFNAGVQLLDLKKLRRMNFTQRLLQIVDTYGVNDQFACNLFAAGNFARIPNEWNHFATQEWIDQPKLIHYTGYIKPWDLEYCPKAEYWRQYIEPADGLARVSATAKSWFK